MRYFRHLGLHRGRQRSRRRPHSERSETTPLIQPVQQCAVRNSVYLCLALLSTNHATAASPFLLGVDYSEFAPPSTSALATDSSGALYLVSQCQSGAAPVASCVTKISADGKTILWQNSLGFAIYSGTAAAVDPNGGVYVAGYQVANSALFIAKLNVAGTGLAWKTSMNLGLSGNSAFTADSQGRTYAANGSEVIRLNATGTAVDYTAQIAGSVTSLAVDGTGAAFVTGNSTAGPFLARLAPDGSAGFYTHLSNAGQAGTVAIDPTGTAVTLTRAADGTLTLQHFNSSGAPTLSTLVGTTTATQNAASFFLDAAGNAYITGSSYLYNDGYSYLSSTRNSLATCGSGSVNSDWLRVLAPDGSLLQGTYLPPGGDASTGIVDAPLIVAGPNATIFVAHSSGSSFAPSQAGPFAANTSGTGLIPYYLSRLSPHANAPIASLACLGSAATYTTGPISPGELVTLFGSGLGPQQGLQPQATLDSPFPTQAAGVQVSFDGTLAPLLSVQDSQINVVVPWSVTPGKTTQVCVSYNGQVTNCLTWPVEQTSASVFTLDGVHAALNQDGSVNSAVNPAAYGSIVSVFVTGRAPSLLLNRTAVW